MLLALICLAVTLLGSVAFGVPVAWLLNGRRPLEQDDWLQAPALGLSAVVLVLYNLVYLDVRVAVATPFIWLAAAGVWAWMLARTPGPLLSRAGTLLGRLPWASYLAALLVFCLHGVGMFRAGAENYPGRNFTDRYNYTAIAQQYVDVPNSASWESIGHKPYLADAMKYHNRERLGAMLLQGFFAVSARTDARMTFEPLMLACLALMVPMVAAMGRRLGLGPAAALLAGVAAGLLPGTGLLRLYCYLSQVTALPLLSLCVLALHGCVRERSWLRAVGASVALAATAAVYVELAVVLIALIVGFLAGGTILRLVSVRRGLAMLAAVPALALVLNLPECLILSIRGRIPSYGAHSLHHLYRLRGLGGFWVHEHWAFDKGRLGWAVVALGVCLTVLALLGLLRVVLGCKGLFTRDGWRDAPYRQRCLLGLSLIGLAVVPLVIYGCGPAAYPYHVCKLVGSVSAVFCLALALACQAVGQRASGLPAFGRAGLACCGVALAVVCGAAGTASLSWQAGSSDPQPRSWQHMSMHPDSIDVVRQLRRLKGEKIVLACGPGVYHNCWLAYAARRNDVWLVNPCVNDAQLLMCQQTPKSTLRLLLEPDRLRGHQLVDLNHLPPEVIVVTSSMYGEPQVELKGGRKLVGGNAHYTFWRLGPGEYHIEPLVGAWRQTIQDPRRVAGR